MPAHGLETKRRKRKKRTKQLSIYGTMGYNITINC